MKNGKKGTGGFTLVELIVVIAILAILAGVGTVAYSGYVKKANEAADQQLLSAVNTAFAAAAVENGRTNTEFELSGVSLDVDGGDCIIGITSNAPSVPTVDESFLKYYAGNTETALKYYKGGKGIVFVNGMFVAKPEWEALSTEQLQAALNTARQVQAALGNSSFSGVEGALLDDVQSLTNAVEIMAGNLSGDALDILLGGSFGAYLTEKGVSSNDHQAIANYATLFLADQVSGLTDAQKEKIAELWSSNTFAYGGNIMDGIQMYTHPDTGLSTMGAMALFYANAEACVQNMAKNYNPTDETEIAQKQAVIEAFNGVADSMGTASDVESVWNALQTGYAGMISACGDNQELASALMTYGTSNGSDANAFIDAMTAINNNESELSSMTNSDSLYGMFAGLFGGN